MAFGKSIHDVVRDAPLGQLVRFFTNNRLFKYPEERSNFKLPEPWIRMIGNVDLDRMPQIEPDTSSAISNSNHGQGAIEEQNGIRNAAQSDLESNEFAEEKSTHLMPKITKDGTVLVDWYYEGDTANPHNWSNLRRGLLSLLICLYTFVVYLSSAIYTSSTEGVVEKFGVSNLKATLGLAMYVLGYGIGPLLFSPLSEIPRIGRSPIYIVTMFLFVVLSIPTALVDNFPGLIVLRFLQGFFGSPCLASGGASMSDMYSMVALPFAMIAWVAAMSCGRKSSCWPLNVFSLSLWQHLSALSSVDLPYLWKTGVGPYTSLSGHRHRCSLLSLSSYPKQVVLISSYAAHNAYASLPATRT